VFSPPERAEDLARALLDLSASPGRLDAMGRSGREHVERYYSRPALARSYLEILEATCDKGRA
jgi:glycosyltransferase involved in cell wall biosynthesis